MCLVNSYLLVILFLVTQYVEHLEKAEFLTDKLAKHDFHVQNADDLFPPHLSTIKIHDGIKQGKLLQGTYKASRDNFLEGYVMVEGYDDPVSFINYLLFIEKQYSTF